MAVIVIAAFIISWLGLMFSGYVITPWIPSFSPEPIVSGYLGFFSGIISLGIIPLLILVALLLRVLMGYRMGRVMRRGVLAIWVVTLIGFVSTLGFSVKNYSHNYRFNETLLTSDISSEDPLIVELKNVPSHLVSPGISLGNMNISRDAIFLYNKKTRLTPNPDGRIALVREGSSAGTSRSEAAKTLEQESPKLKDGRLVINNYSIMEKGDKYRNQWYRYDLQLPIGKRVKFDTKRKHLRLNGRKYYTDKVYEMTEDGLVEV